MAIRNLQFQKIPVYYATLRTKRHRLKKYNLIAMDIIWHGNSCFSIKAKGATTVINPYKDGKGAKLPDLKGEIVIVTGNQEGNDFTAAVKGDPKIVDWPGEYEISGVVLTAIPAPNEKGFFLTMVCENTRICYLENIGKSLDEDLVDKIGDVDILILPVGGKEGLDAETAHNIAESIEPRCVIPMNFHFEGSSAGLSPADAFLKLAGAANAQSQGKFSIAGRSSLKEDQTECIVLEPQVG